MSRRRSTLRTAYRVVSSAMLIYVRDHRGEAPAGSSVRPPSSLERVRERDSVE